jgi:hypothetical protein
MDEQERIQKTLELRVNFWLKRLDHTLTHTQTSTNHIYLVDGAVLALLYFAVQTFGTSRQVILVASIPTFFLAALNLLHARFINVQHSWYSLIDERLRQLLQQEKLPHKEKFWWFSSTHDVYRAIHAVIAIVLFVGAVAMFLYGKYAWWGEIPMPSKSSTQSAS